MRAVASLASVFILALGLAACGGEETELETPEGEVEIETD